VKTPEQRGAFGAWLVEQRQRLSLERGHKVLQQHVVDELAEAGYPMDPAYYRAIEGGSKRPGRDTREALERFFGRTSPLGQAESGAQDLGRLVRAIEAQTDAINRLLARLEQGLPEPVPDDLLEAAGELNEHLSGIQPPPPEAPPGGGGSRGPAGAEPRSR
jgi:hypothetical protein